MQLIWKFSAFAGLLVAGGGLGWMVGRFAKASMPSVGLAVPGLAHLLVQIPAAFLLVVLVHELGHVLGGRWAGFRFVMLVVGPFKWVREQAGIRWRLNRSLNTFGGLALLVPTRNAGEPGRMARYILGGPVASIGLFVCGAFGIAVWWPVVLQQGGAGHAVFFLVLTTALALLTGLITLVPVAAGGYASDGGQFLDLVRGGARAERRLLMLNIAALSLNGVRPRDWDGAQISCLLDLADGRLDQLAVAAHHSAFYHFLDAGQVDRAGSELDRATELVEHYPSELRQGVWLERAFFLARYRQHLSGATEALTRGTNGFVEAHTRARVEAAVALARGDVDAARAAIDVALARIDRSVDPGGARAEQDWLLEMRAETARLSPRGQ